MIDARIFVHSLEDVRNILKEQNAEFKGKYVIRDTIYDSKDPNVSLDACFLRLRIYTQNIWDQKNVIIAIKNTEVKSIGKESIIPFKKEFDTEEDAKQFIKDNYADTFEFDFEFSRTGWQYDLGTDQIDLEDIEGHLSIEFKSPTEEGLSMLLQKFNIGKDTVIKGPAVTPIKKLLKNA